MTLTIYDVAGQTVATLVQDHQASGDYTIRWNARNDAGQSVASGIYFYRLDAGSITMTRKMSLLR
ncbi:MAG: T9SS type A sorting domain-containing protein [Gemmatimonadetes bacterium]|nr:T9SS type A sorting domain-containing protein [Gemmatimonadota bacterium]